jgi:hypothetical protein
VSDVVIENPILNSPYKAPTRHWRFNDDGITNEIEDGRRKSTYFMPIPASRRRADPRLTGRAITYTHPLSTIDSPEPVEPRDG